EISGYLTGEHGVSKWWAQKLIVEYEQRRGIRAAGVRKGGTFTITATKTVNAHASRVFEAVADARARRRWLPGLTLRKRTAQAGRSIRFDADDDTRINVTFLAQGRGKSQVAVEQEKLLNEKAADRAKSAWRASLARLKELVEG
ncbi:MAG: hypothetical protein ACRDJP_00850, partial [Actinomycetota bacterium]